MKFTTKYRIVKKAAFFFAFLLLFESFVPSALALTGGPSQPEVEYFSPVSNDNMVDLFTGAFGYSIPLLDVGGYPLVLTYNSNVNMMDEASFVGLGWNLNTGVIQRNLRGIPDDFAGDYVKQEINMKPNRTYGLDVALDLEFFGISAQSLGANVSAGLMYNNFRGLGLNLSLAPSKTLVNTSWGPLTANLGINANSFSGVNLNASLNLIDKRDENIEYINSLGYNFGSREGMKSIYLNQNRGVKETRVSRNDNLTYSFGNPTHTPMIRFPQESINLSYSVKLGPELVGTFPAGQVRGNFSYQGLKRNVDSLPAFGYIYADQARNLSHAMMDFNREKEGAFIPEMPLLPLSNFSYDVYNASGAGISGVIRPHRGDIAMLNDSRVSHNALDADLAGLNVPLPSLDVSVEVGAANAFHLGADIVANFSNSNSSAWNNNNLIKDHLNFISSDDTNPAYEPFYFKNGAEITPLNRQLFDQTGGSDAVAVDLEGSHPALKASARLVNNQGNSFNLNEPVKMSERQSRNQHFSFLTAGEAFHLALQRHIRDFHKNNFTDDPYIFRRVDQSRKPHHMGEITITNEGGQRYVYGIPAYNHYQKDATFNVSGRVSDCATGLVNYMPGEDNTVENNRGIDHYYHATHLPGYAHSFLLTAILSPDYVDLTGDGPSPDDLGSYTLFNYNRALEDYRWRIPYEQNMASHQPGKLTDSNDEKGHYVYGEKEIWYLHSIETKNYIAEFTLADRKDGLEVRDENGGRNLDPTRRLQKLKRIDLYTKAGRDAKTPLKSVHFEYDYSLTPGIPSSENYNVTGQEDQSGKLTLRKVYFTYGDSKRGKHIAYEFNYNDLNPAYDPAAADIWGNYKPNDCLIQPNREFPYTPQSNREWADNHAAPWSLTEIKLPSGGRIEIEYEAGDYSYVQDQRAMQMFRIAGFSSNPEVLPDNPNRLYEDEMADHRPNNFVFFDLKEPVSASDSQLAQAKLSDYFEGIDELYFSLLTDIKGETPVTPVSYAISLIFSGGDSFENIDGFIPVNLETYGEDFGFYQGSLENGSYTKAWIKLPDTRLGDTNLLPGLRGYVNPMSRQVWQYLKNHMPAVAYNSPTFEQNIFEDLVSSVTGLAGELLTMVTGLNDWLRERMVASEATLERSFIRLNSPDKMKIGGTSRVKRVLMYDEWAAMAGDAHETMVYGKEYFYTKTETINGQPRTISSGVAAWEPSVSFENPLRQPIRYNVDRESRYITGPFGESFFPAPVIGYSRVKVANLARENVAKTGVGHEVHEFYTAKDFPVYVERTDVNVKAKKPNLLSSFAFSYNEYLTVSQGFLIETNDMHGKKKAHWIYPEGSDIPLSGVEYHYKAEGNRLVNEVTTIDSEGNIEENVLMGIDYDLAIDTREEISESNSVGIELNTDGFLLAIVPVVIPIPLPRLNEQKVEFRSIVATKTIKRKGLIERIVTYDNGAKMEREVVAYDAVSGQQMINRRHNEHMQAYYETSIPAWWEYPRMGMAYQNNLIQFQNINVTGSNGHVQINNAGDYFTQGDELLVRQDNMVQRAWVLNIQPNHIYLIRQNGSNLPSGEYDLKIIRSGYRNQTSANAGSLITLQNPIAQGTLQFNDVIDASAVEFSEQWQTYKGMNILNEPEQCECEILTYFDRFTGKDRTFLERALNSLVDSNFLTQPRVQVGQSGAERTIWNSRISGGILEGYFSTLTGDGLKYPEEEQCRITVRNLGGFDFPPGGEFTDFQMIKPEFECDTIFEFTGKYTFTIDHQEITYNIRGSNTCMPIAICQMSEPLLTYHCELPFGEKVNPFALGILGNFRPKQTFLYQTNRQSSGRVADDGVFESFTPYWDFLTGNDKTNWISANELTKIDPFGSLLEEKDALGRYSAELKGFNNNLVIATASNARHQQIAFDSFEDKNYQNRSLNAGECDQIVHLQGKWKSSGGFTLTNQGNNYENSESHTGKYSARVTSLNYLEYDINLQPECHLIQAESHNINSYHLQPCDVAGTFNPSPGKYLLSVWVNDKNNLSGNGHVNIIITGSSPRNYTLEPSGLPIDGWQKIEGVFEIPQGSQRLRIQLKAATGSFGHFRFNSGNSNFDDLRIQPFNSMMQTYVYHPETLRLVAILDENNYATFFEYDEEGQLITIKKETHDGIVTLQESYRSVQKQ
ncbi:MAG: hypothetical protein EA393_12565 [Bacteroidetes bacterium]|nr:MAG: hypothetical protein EA393_12565 [Bacteroidota bacterium]